MFCPRAIDAPRKMYSRSHPADTGCPIIYEKCLVLSDNMAKRLKLQLQIYDNPTKLNDHEFKHHGNQGKMNKNRAPSKSP